MTWIVNDRTREVIEMLTALTSLFKDHHPMLREEQLKQREWERCLANANSQNERDEINDLFSGAVAA
jgi:hypothetical protein